jgi:hypothetical protein
MVWFSSMAMGRGRDLDLGSGQGRRARLDNQHLGRDASVSHQHPPIKAAMSSNDLC